MSRNNPLMTIIAISGKRGAGKSTLAKFMEKHGYRHMSLAGPLKEMCASLYGLTYEQLYGTAKEVPTIYTQPDGKALTARDILIREGCLKRSIDPLFWCKRLHQQIQYGEKIVIDDLRFKNEIKYFAPLGAYLVRLERDQKAIGMAPIDDISETELDGYQEWDALLSEEFNRTPKDLDRFSSYLASKFSYARR